MLPYLLLLQMKMMDMKENEFKILSEIVSSLCMISGSNSEDSKDL